MSTCSIATPSPALLFEAGRPLARDQADTTQFRVGHRLMLGLVIDVLHVAAGVRASGVSKGPSEDERQFRSVMSVHRQPAARSELEEVQLTFHARRQRKTMMPDAGSEALPRNVVECKPILVGDRRRQVVLSLAVTARAASRHGGLTRSAGRCDPGVICTECR